MDYRCTSDMDLAEWLDDMQRLYNYLCNMDTECLDDQCFALAVLDNMPGDGSWDEFLSPFYTTSGTLIPIDSTESLTAIRNEYWHRNQNKPQISSHFFSARDNADKKTQKRSQPPDASTSHPVKRLRASSDELRTNARCTPLAKARLGDDITVTSLSAVSGEDTPKDNSCYYGSGDQHVFHDRTAFETYKIIEPITENGISRNSYTGAIGRGTVRLEGRYGDRTPSILLREVLHIPAARFNMISGIRLDKASIVATSVGGVITLSNGAVNVVSGSLHNGLYRLNLSIIRSPNPRSLVLRSDRPNPITRITPLAIAGSSEFYVA
ncbi:hypothetical protein DFH94DRAFT_117168 [Russula ochroleuca]|jgi:hypothetical protein|uniref:Retrovirus-related Pol polyprotein from transposon TNT 1-94-like beta-barrel domain-containing protein n=1 Tax=Russula ochroleuca TaxID=152965 RepID=A0A9P5MNN3_9AGAM|nr:hypothetical protein DFH94DRAFT_117168 [Russula ochroleuca]